ncbi:MAG: hypothetical protein PVF69_07195, partial [Gemmatimonadota bacterium]
MSGKGDDQAGLTRREALRLLGTGGGAGLLAGLGLLSTADRAAAAARLAGVTNARALGAATTAQQIPVIRAVTGDIPLPAIRDGAILFHEHLSMHYPIGSETSFSDDVDLMIEEVHTAGQEGVGIIVDGGHPDMDRDIENLRRIDEESGVRVVASGGFYMQNTYPPRIADMSAEEIADELVEDADRNHLGAFGEIGQEEGVLTDDERKVHRAVALAHLQTGLPVFTHNAYSIRATDV